MGRGKQAFGSNGLDKLGLHNRDFIFTNRDFPVVEQGKKCGVMGKVLHSLVRGDSGAFLGVCFCYATNFNTTRVVPNGVAYQLYHGALPRLHTSADCD